MSVVVDTNVLVVANGKHEPAQVQCIGACIDALAEARTGLVVIDDAQHILAEYRRHCSFAGQPGVGDAFFKWLWQRQADPRHCLVVHITPHPKRGFAEFPADEQLAKFDRSDRKFAAVALAAGDAPPILNACDTDWWLARHALDAHGLTVNFLCPELMAGAER
ncbi:MAG: hypothetical protein Q8M01_06565 [Rubrivivax sp.]|nr:hypothetical protein [Rubrivivax sp.]